MKLSLHLDKYGIDYMEVTFLLSCPNTTRKSKHFYFLCLMQTTFCLSRKRQSTQVSWVKRWLQWPSKSTVPHAWIQPISDQKYMFFFFNFQKLSKCKIWICHTPATIYFHMVLVVKNPAARDGFDSWVGKIPWRRTWQLPPVFLPGKRILVGYSPLDCKTSDMTERLSSSHYLQNIYIVLGVMNNLDMI